MPASQSSNERVLACALCKQRRVKCNRIFPCQNCLHAGAQCVPQAAAHPRRRRFPERALLDRLRRYEDLLRQHHIAFEPLHGSPGDSGGASSSSDVHLSSSTNSGSVRDIDVWTSIQRVALEDSDDDCDDEDDDGKTEAAGNTNNNNESNKNTLGNPDQTSIDAMVAHNHLLFGAPSTDFNLAAAHPRPMDRLRLWQIYLDNVDPLLKVTHTPTLQPRIIEAAADEGTCATALDALMFSIYCVAIMSLEDGHCQSTFLQPRDVLLLAFQTACKQALLACAPWQSDSHDGLTAWFLYLVSLSQQVDPWSLATMAAAAVRVAQRMGLPCESSYNRHHHRGRRDCSPLEAELRRRLWWALVQFDHRLCDIIGQQKSTSLTPAWDCRLLQNVNDFEMLDTCSFPHYGNKAAAAPTEAIFAVVRSEIADFVRKRPSSHAAILSGAIAGNQSHNDTLDALETRIDATYLAHCHENVPLHFVAIWTTRSFFARSRLMDHYLTHAVLFGNNSVGKTTLTSNTHANAQQRRRRFCLTDDQRHEAFGHALRMVECDTLLRTSPLLQAGRGAFVWLVEAQYSPVLAYFHILHGLAKQPAQRLADCAWAAMCANYSALADGPPHHRTRIMFARKFSHVALAAWDARVAWRRQNGGEEREFTTPLPRLVADARASMTPGIIQRHVPGSMDPGVATLPHPSTPDMASFSFSHSKSLELAHDQPDSSGAGDNIFAMTSSPSLLPLGLPPGMPSDMGIDMEQFWLENAGSWF